VVHATYNIISKDIYYVCGKVNPHLGERVELYVLQFGLGKEGEPNTWCSVLVVQVGYVLPGNVLSIVLDKSGDYHFMIHCACALRHTPHW